MKKTFLIGFIGLFLVGGFVTGLYLINQQTNPASRAAEETTELVNPVKPPPTVAQSEKPTYAECEKLFGTKKADVRYEVKCDLDNDGAITVLDLRKLK